MGCSVRESVWRDEPVPMIREMLLPDGQIVLEKALISLAGQDAAWRERIWSEADEQVIPVTTRQVLRQNGFRVGVLGLALPNELRTVLEESAALDATAGRILPGSGDELPWAHQRLRMRFRQRHEFVVGDVREELTIFTVEAGHTRGQTFELGQTLFGVTAIPSSADSIVLELVPEIHFGEARHRYTAREGAFRLEESRESERLQHLTCQVPMRAGQTLLLGTSGASQSLGGSFFSQGGENKLLLIRLAATPRRKLPDAAGTGAGST